jgi:outer membrane protein TolC
VNCRLDLFRRSIALGLCFGLVTPLASAWQSIEPIKPAGNILWRDYKAPFIPASRLANGPRFRSLIRGGKLYLTAQDAISLALENNIDIESDRYNALIDETQYIRAQAGGALPGVPSANSTAGTVASGEGVAGSQAAAGVSSNGGGGSGGSSNTTITQIGPVTPTLDPTIQDVQSYAHKTAPQYISTQSQTLSLIDDTRNYQESINEGFIYGGKASLTYSDAYLKENAATDILYPQNATTLSLSVQQNLLNGFGRAVNARNITIAKANVGINDLTFQTQVIAVVVNVLNAYYGLVADIEDIKAKQNELEVARRFFEDNKKQVEIGTMAPLDVTTAEAQVATSQQDLVVSQTTLEQQQVTLKNLLSRNGLADPQLANVDIVPLDRIEVPENETLPPVTDLVKTAFANRVDLEANKLNLVNAETNTLGTRNGVLPTLVGLGTVQAQGLSGTPKTVVLGTAADIGTANGAIPPGLVACPTNPKVICEVADKYFVGGIGTALGQMIRRDFPSQSAGVYFGPTLRNRQAQADEAIDQLGLRQTELENQRTVNQVAVDVSNQLVGLQQARVRYLAAVKNRVLQEQLLTAEQKKFALGASTTFNVVTEQRDLAAAQSTEVASLVAYSNARVSLDQTLGTTLKTNHIDIAQVAKGQVR